MDEQKSLTDYRAISIILSAQMDEPAWFSNHRLKAFEQLDQLVPPKIERLDYSEWPLWNVEDMDTSDGYDNQTMHTNHKNVLICDFQEAFIKEAPRFEAAYKKSEFMALNDLYQAYTTAFMTDSLFVYIPKNVHVEQPIALHFMLQKRVSNRQVLIYAAANSSVKIIDRYESSNSTAKTLNNHIQIIAEEGANIHYSSLDHLDQQTTAYMRRMARLEKDARVDWALGSMNDGHVIEDVQVFLDGSGSTSDVKTVAISNQQQTQVVNVQVKNIGTHTTGNIFQHGAALNQSTLTFNGIGHILKHAKHSDAQQESRILMLSDEARADANPILLIDEYEVTAGHAASITRVDPTQLYYLMSRGLAEKQAEKLVIRGFLGIVLSEISVPEVRQKLADTMERKLAQYGSELA